MDKELGCTPRHELARQAIASEAKLRQLLESDAEHAAMLQLDTCPTRHGTRNPQQVDVLLVDKHA